MAISREYLEVIIKDWTENLWLLNNQSRIKDAKSKITLSQEFNNLFYPDNNRGLTRSQSFSEQSFILSINAVCDTVGRISRKAAHIILDNKLIDSWRRSVWRNSFQQKYEFFESCLQETIDRYGVKSAIAQYPKNCPSTGNEIIEAFENIGYRSKHIDQKIIKDLIRQAAAKPVPKNPKP